MRTLAIAVAVALSWPQLGHSKDLAFEVQPDGRRLVMPRLKIEPGSKTVVLPMAGPVLIEEDADAVVHLPTGLRLPRAHAGCRLSAVLPLAPAENGRFGYERGAMAEYDCTPSDGLTHVEVSFETGMKFLKKQGLDNGLQRLAGLLTKSIAGFDQVICNSAAPSPHPLHPGLSAVQCGLRWGPRDDSAAPQFGVATVALRRGDSFIRFTRKCVDAQCDASRDAFGTFFGTFDLSGYAVTRRR